MRRARVLGALLFAWTVLRAQPSDKSEFDVVSIKIDHEGTGGAGDEFPSHGTWKWTRIPLSFLITDAYGVSLQQIVNVPSSFQGRDPAFDIVAKMPENVTDEQFRAMLQSMLAERFKFAMHRETRDISVNTIEVAKGGPKLTPATAECVPVPHSTPVASGQYRCGEVLHRIQIKDGVIQHIYSGRSVTAAGLAQALSGNGPVFDDTGLKDKFDMEVIVSGQISQPPADSAEQSAQRFEYNRTLSAAFEKQIGLSIDMNVQKKRPATVIVVDHVELPTPN